MTEVSTETLFPLLSAWLVGSLIGLERSFRGRPAGFRTHALVAVSSAMLMLVTTQQLRWLGEFPEDMLRTDPARMAQGIMTGIGFLGAGVIFKEGINVRGLTTAASIWATAAIGILLGVGLYWAGIIAAAITVGTLSLFHLVESRLPTQSYAHLTLRFAREHVPPEHGLRELLKELGYQVSDIGYRMADNGEHFEYRMVVHTLSRSNGPGLVERLNGLPELRGYRMSRTGY
ncbi:MgtC/SapB family protein [Algiphilus sp. W345]|uniref:Protein MgtC n=1 Tax=Banduia mediterranea TaxID=3075609 RepID=A0ABU2WJ22_9GAMM|nr:MgtC/SapB family protein [Algiphilus sp. W345]MDT0497867.1 MgtC/SapB family protein [Algiphilus sp. W345]